MLADTAPVRLNPTDFEILGYLRDGRNIAPNMATALDRDRKYINSRMGYLLDYGLVRRVEEPGVERAGLYEITERGRAAADLRGEYDKDNPSAFDELIRRELDQ